MTFVTSDIPQLERALIGRLFKIPISWISEIRWS
jgi:hypothetical protein